MVGIIIFLVDWSVVSAGVILATFALVVSIALTAAAADRLWRAKVARDFRSHFGPTKDLLIVYTDSPHWGSYIEERWLPRWGARAVVLNRSRPWDRRQPEVRLWVTKAGGREHTPVAIVIPRDGKIAVVRFFAAFRDLKHGHPEALRAAEAQLAAELGDHAG